MRAPYQYASGILFKSNMPAVMAETVFITNKDEGRILADPVKGPERRDQIAQHLNAGIESYFSSVVTTSR